MGICEGAPDEYCGHILEPEGGEADDGWHERLRNAVCIREPKYDGLCVWHADTDQKTAEELVEARLMPDDVSWETDYVKEHLSGTILREIEFPEGFSFSGCIIIFAEFFNVTIHAAEFSDAELSGAKFSGVSFFGGEFSGANLQAAKFTDSFLTQAEFAGTTLLGAEFPDADLAGAKFPDADLAGAEFPQAFLREAEFPEAYLREAEFPGANLREAKFPRANLREAEFPGSYLPGAKFPEASLQEANLFNTTLSGAKFSDANLAGAECPEAYADGASFRDTFLAGAEFHEALLRRAEFTDADLPEAEFPGADLREAKFLRTNLLRTNLSEANVQGVVFSEADLRDTIFRPSCEREIKSQNDEIEDSSGASLEEAQFEDGTDLRGANLSGARLYQTAFRDVRINDETAFGWDDGSRYGEKCRYDYDPNTGVSTNEDVSRVEAAAWTYRRLESLFEENAMDDRARNAHIRKEEAQRRHQLTGVAEPFVRVLPDRLHDRLPQGLKQTDPPEDSWIKSFGQYAVSTLNWRLHRHGESLRQLLKVSAVLILTCGFLYVIPWSGVARNNPETLHRITGLAEFTQPGAYIDLLNGLYFSVITFTTIGYGDFYPASTLSRLLVGFESLAGALLIALFVFVIGRRVAR